MSYIKPVLRARARASQVNSLICNIGLALRVSYYLNQHGVTVLVWIVEYYGDGAVIGVDYYKHERSAMRRVWKLYRKHTGD